MAIFGAGKDGREITCFGLLQPLYAYSAGAIGVVRRVKLGQFGDVTWTQFGQSSKQVRYYFLTL